MIAAWEKLKVEMPTYATVINAGLHKLIDYQDRISLVPAYKLAIGKEV